jgi:hypothetical protein
VTEEKKLFMALAPEADATPAMASKWAVLIVSLAPPRHDQHWQVFHTLENWNSVKMFLFDVMLGTPS